ncbi:TRAP transporter large permease subunit [Alcanivorax sp. JB21]|uniref:TRAP transporter large permease n=1 Tax=Alcanivorax limicola TaxID=2874102 RepID=UPI001CC15FA2|nr:TRAP transporter large permease subunit [Alcanivorax limicola]MBZ2188796.1 TRAP transporter large permease subunit [Alcanivorax limicola]
MAIIALLMFVTVCLVLMAGYPVAFTLGGVALLFAFAGMLAGVFDPGELGLIPNRLFGIVSNTTLIAVPLFVFMGMMLEKSRIAEDLLGTLSRLFGPLPGGMGIAIILVGALLAASTGIVGATVVTMGLIALPTMLRQGYHPGIASGLICATGTLGQIIPPSIALILLGDVLATAYQQAQLRQGLWSFDSVSVGDLFAGAVVPGLVLVGLYAAYILAVALWRPHYLPRVTPAAAGDAPQPPLARALITSLLPPLLLIVAVLGAILTGKATPTEAAAVGATGATLLAILRRQLSLGRLQDVMRGTVRVTSMVFMILIGASVFSLVFHGYGGGDAVERLLTGLPGGAFGAMLMVMLLIFLLGFILDFIEITFVVVPIVAPALLMLGLDPIWLGVMIALNLQTSFLTPPFGFALFYLRGVAPATVNTADIYRGVIPFILIQLLMLLLLAVWPALATWLPGLVSR